MEHKGESEAFTVLDVFDGGKEAIFWAYEVIWEVWTWWEICIFITKS